jgi:protein TonB
MFALFLLLAAVPPGIAVVNTAPPPVVLPPQSLPPAAIQPAVVLQGPQERGSTQSYISPDDYPAAAEGSGAHGIVRFTLTIDPAGRVVGCNIRQSSGSSVLDAATCNIMRRRARYTPARDSNGNPAVGTIEQQIEWKAPSR